MQTKLQKVYFQCDFVCIWAALSECNYEGMRSRQMFEVQQKMHICKHMRTKIVKYSFCY
jgi:hypothetical protein